MKLEILNKICFTICIVCIVAAALLSLLLIWAEVSDRELVWKAWLTIAVIFLASAMTLAVTKSLYSRNNG